MRPASRRTRLTLILFNVLEHLVEPLDLLREVGRILKPGGYLGIKTPLPESVQGRILGQRWMLVTEVPRHVLLASTEGIGELARRAGLNLVDKRPGSLLENSSQIALSLMPKATSHIACGGDGGLQGNLHRLAGFGIGLAAIPFALFERIVGRSGIMIYLAQKDGDIGPRSSK